MRVLTLRELNRATLARVELVGRCPAAFGPASRADLADCSGMRVSDLAEAFQALEPFAPLPRAVRRELEDEAGRLAEFAC